MHAPAAVDAWPVPAASSAGSFLRESVRSSVPPIQSLLGLLNIFGPYEQVGSANRWIHSPGVVGPDHGLNLGIIQNALRNLRIDG
jgi:hypothetical protein